MPKSVKSFKVVGGDNDHKIIGLSSSVVCCRRAVTAAVVEPVGLKAYWSRSSSARGGLQNSGCI